MSYSEQQHHDEPEHELEINQIDSGSLQSTSISVNKVRIGGYIIMEEHPCKVVDLSKSKPGKHGHAKAKIAGTDIFTGRRFETQLPTSHNIGVPIVDRTDYVLINIDGNNTQLIDDRGLMREDVELDKTELSDRVRNEFETADSVQLTVTVLTWMNQAKIVDLRKTA